MSFLTPALLIGVSLIAVPIILHLVMRRQPQRLVFPALRFIQQRREANRRRINLRHWLLLAMRCLLIAGLALALARPTVTGSGLRGKAGAPLAVTMVIDNSLRMQYVRRNQTRLEQAAESATQLIEKLADDAAVSVVDLGAARRGFIVDRTTALSRLANLRTIADARPLADAIVEAIDQTSQQEDHRQEVFVFSDLARSQWSDEALESISAALDGAPDVQLYLIDVGVDSHENSSLGDVQLQRNVLRPGEAVHLEAAVLTSGSADAPLVELSLTDSTGDGGEVAVRKRDQRIAEPDKTGAMTVSFDLADLPLGTHQGMLQLVASDPLMVDNSRYFTVEVRPPARVLLLADSEQDAIFVREALQPSLLDEPPRFLCDVRPFGELATLSLDPYDATLLLDPPPLGESVWEQLLQYAEAGGGVGIFLGHHARLDSMNDAAAQRLLPGPLETQARDETYLRPQRLDHPSLAALRDYQETIPWSECRVFTYWAFLPLHGDAYVIARFANNEPAIIERQAGRGRLLTMATPLSDPLDPPGRPPWNVLTAPGLAWPFVAICDELTGYLAQDADVRLNYQAGDTVRVPIGMRRQVSKYILRGPDGQRQRRTSPPGEAALVLSTTEQLGNYRLTAGGGENRLDRGFSVNAAAERTELERIAGDKLTSAMPADRFRLAESLGDAEAYVDIGRSGRELFPWALLIVSVVWGAEHWLANRFYRGAAPR